MPMKEDRFHVFSNALLKLGQGDADQENQFLIGILMHQVIPFS
jgi:hypothetical protein